MSWNTQFSGEPSGSQKTIITILSALILLLFILSIQFAFLKLGLDKPFIPIILVVLFLGSIINIPIGEMRSTPRTETQSMYYFGWEFAYPVYIPESKTKIFVNLSGALMPVAISAILLIINPLIVLPTVLAIIPITYFCNKFAQIIPNRGIGMPLFVPPLVGFGASNAITTILEGFGMVFTTQELLIIIYAATTMGTLVGADLLNLHKIKETHVSMISIGGAGTFDGIFLAGILAVLLLA